MFPKFYDTKMICWLNLLDEGLGVQYRHRLELTYQNLYDKEGILPETYYTEGFDRYTSKTIYHEAAFDAMQTGMVFLAFCDQNKDIEIKALNRVKPFFNLVCDHLDFGRDYNESAIDPDVVGKMLYFVFIDVNALKSDPEYFKKTNNFYFDLIKKELGGYCSDDKIRLSKPNLFYNRKDCYMFTFILKINEEDHKNFYPVLSEKMEILKKKYTEINFMTVSECKKYIQEKIIDSEKGCKHWGLSYSSAKFLKDANRDDLNWLKSNREKKNIGDMIFKVLDYYIEDTLRTINALENKHYVIKLRERCYNELNWKSTDKSLVFDVEKFLAKFDSYNKIVSFIMECKTD